MISDYTSEAQTPDALPMSLSHGQSISQPVHIWLETSSGNPKSIFQIASQHRARNQQSSTDKEASLTSAKAEGGSVAKVQGELESAKREIASVKDQSPLFFRKYLK